MSGVLDVWERKSNPARALSRTAEREHPEARRRSDRSQQRRSKPVKDSPPVKEGTYEPQIEKELRASMTKTEAKVKLKEIEKKLYYERQRRKEAEREFDKQQRNHLRHLHTAILRGGSTDPNSARLVSKDRTPTGNFFVGMDSNYLDKPNEVTESRLHEYIAAAKKDKIEVLRQT